MKGPEKANAALKEHILLEPCGHVADRPHCRPKDCPARGSMSSRQAISGGSASAQGPPALSDINQEEEFH